MIWFIRLTKLSAIVLMLVIIQLIIFSVLPSPFSSLNLMFVFLVLFMFRKEAGGVVWIAFGTQFFAELYAATPFGVLLFSGTISTLLSYWLFQQVFTNRSWYSGMAVCMCALFIYRLFYTSLLFGIQLISRAPTIPPLFLLRVYGWELVLTTILTGLAYLISDALAKPKRPFVLLR